MDQLALKHRGQQLSLVDRDPRGRTGARVQQVGDDARIIGVPVPVRNVRMHSRTFFYPGTAGQLVMVTKIAELHDVIDAHRRIAVVVVVTLPDRAERIDRGHPIVPKVPTQRLQFAAVQVTAKYHSLLIGLD